MSNIIEIGTDAEMFIRDKETGKVISGFKTMKYFEGQLPFYFFRVHNSYIVNIKFVTRINLGKFNFPNKNGAEKDKCF